MRRDLLLLFRPKAAITKVGPDGGSLVTIIGSEETWSSPNNLLSQTKTAFAQVALQSTFTQSDTAEVTGFGFALPTGKSIKNVTVNIYGDGSSAGPTQYFVIAALYNGGVQIGSTKAINITGVSAPQEFTIGGDLWGLSSLTSDTVNGTGFGVGFWLFGSMGQSVMANLTAVQMTIKY